MGPIVMSRQMLRLQLEPKSVKEANIVKGEKRTMQTHSDLYGPRSPYRFRPHLHPTAAPVLMSPPPRHQP